MVILISAAITFCILRLILPFLGKYFISKPNARSSHELNIPTAGGIGFVLVGSIGMILLNNFSVLFCLPLALVGLWDDKVSLSPVFRYFVQLITCIVLFFNSSLGISFFHDLNLLIFIPLFVIYLIASTGIINFINFMDGLDGLVASCTGVFISLFAFLVDPTYFVLLGSLLGFLILNWHPAKLFMGDIGSTYLGSILVLCLLNAGNIMFSFALLLILMPLLLDAALSVIRRFIDGQIIFEPHSLHLFQRLHKAGWSHSKVSLLYLTSTLLITIIYYLFGIISAGIITGLIFFTGIWIDKKYASPFN